MTDARVGPDTTPFCTLDVRPRGAFYNFEPREFPSEEAPGIGVFCKDEHGEVFQAYSDCARGFDLMVGAYSYLDLAPRGRGEDALAFTMAWVRTSMTESDQGASAESLR